MNVLKVILFVGLWCAAVTSNAAFVSFQFDLSGDQEVGAGDADGYGFADLTIDSEALTIDWDVEVFNLDSITGMHIHQGLAGANGSVVVNFAGQLSGSSLFDADLSNILANPTGYYLNVHTSSFQGGAIRGQLPEPVPVPAAGLLFLIALAGLSAVKRLRK